MKDVGNGQMTDNSIVEPSTYRKPISGRFSGKVALITGASDRGIGGAIAERMASEGAAVSLVAPIVPKRLLKRLQRLDQGVVWTTGDVTKKEDVQLAIDRCMDEFGKIDILVNNAGIDFACPLEKITDQQWQQLLDVNLGGVIRMTRETLPYLAAPGGVIVNVASALALAGCPGFSVYSASKAGLISMTQSLAWELAPQRIRVVCVAPGLVESPMTFRHIHHRTLEVQKQIDASHPLGTGSPHDVASAIAFLASDEARWITGVTLPLGWTQNYPLPVEQFMTHEQ